MTARLRPSWEWTDAFGDTLEVYEAGEDLVVSISPKHPHPDSDRPAVSLSPEQQRGLRAALGVHIRSLT